MDPLTALSVAGTVVQLVDFGTKLLSNGVELYRSTSGELKAHEELELITADLRSVVIKLRSVSAVTADGLTSNPAAAGPPLENSFYKICDKAVEIAGELLHKIDGLRVKDGKHHAWESVKAALKTALSKDEIASLRARLSSLQDSLVSGSLLLLV